MSSIESHVFFLASEISYEVLVPEKFEKNHPYHAQDLAEMTVRPHRRLGSAFRQRILEANTKIDLPAQRSPRQAQSESCDTAEKGKNESYNTEANHASSWSSHHSIQFFVHRSRQAHLRRRRK